MNGLRYEMRPIPAGEFVMGSNTGDQDERPTRVVRVRGFSLGKTEVTQGLWKAIMGHNSTFPINATGDDRPVDSVSYEDCLRFIDRLNQLAKVRFRLPTEAEWEYACRAGTVGDRYGDLLEIAWFDRNSETRPPLSRPVGGKRPNAWGLHDMLGNVWEWCDGWYEPDQPSGARRVLRGGAYHDREQRLRASKRVAVASTFREHDAGFRLAMN